MRDKVRLHAEKRPQMFLLTIDIPDEPPVILPTDLAVLIGRGDLCDVQLQDPTLSRVHCRVIAHDGRVTLYDAGSRWGTFVNDQRITECTLKLGDRIRIGGTTLHLELESGPNDTTLSLEAGSLLNEATKNPQRMRPAGFNAAENFMPGNIFESFSEVSIRNDQGPPANKRRPSKQRFTSNEFLGKSFHLYHVLRLVAESAYGFVYYAEMRKNRSPLALKIFRPTFFKSEIEELRFTRAVNTMFGKKHANIVELLNAGRWHGWFFTASEFVEGVSALELIQRIGIMGMLPPDKVLQMALDLCESLRFAEQNSIVHRNITPSNILVRKADATTLLNDLILARGIDTAGAAQLTMAGEVIGNVSYMSPEQLGSGHSLDHRSDIYQLGATLYALLSGQPPLQGGTMANTIVEILTANPESTRIKNIAIPAQLDAIVLKMLAKNPGDRYQSAKELAIALDKVGKETRQHRVRSTDADPRATGWKGALDGLL